MTATTTTTTSTTAATGRDRAAFRVRSLARAAGSVLGAVGRRWNDFVDAGQLGPSAEMLTGRHTGARI